MRNIIYLLFVASFIVISPVNASYEKQEALKIKLGEKLFFDNILSKNRTQSCAQCHNPAHAFIDNRDNGVNSMASLGDDGITLGDRNSPTLTYISATPDLHFSRLKREWIGGFFYDGRAKSIEEQAGIPPLSEVEMGMESVSEIVNRLKNNPKYNKDFKNIYGEDVFNDENKVYQGVKDSIGAFQKTATFSTFDSKYDRYLAGKEEFNELEDLGRSLFFSNNLNCNSCHQLKNREGAKGETFTNYEYHNIGVPINTFLREKNNSPKGTIDYGLFANKLVSNDTKHKGKIKVPTLRNVAVTGPYMHNGVFEDLTTVVLFYDKYVNSNNTINPETNEKWREAEVTENLAKDLNEGKKMNEKKVKALVAFLNTLTDKRYENLITD